MLWSAGDESFPSFMKVTPNDGIWSLNSIFNSIQNIYLPKERDTKFRSLITNGATFQSCQLDQNQVLLKPLKSIKKSQYLSSCQSNKFLCSKVESNTYK